LRTAQLRYDTRSQTGMVVSLFELGSPADDARGL